MVDNKSYFWWLNFGALFLSVLFFFERIPSFETALGPIRLSHVLVPFLIVLITVGLYQKRSQIQSLKIPLELICLAVFVLTGVLSFFNITNLARFYSASLGLFLCFGSTILLSVIKLDYQKLIRLYFWLFVALIIFSFYQFAGDMLGLPSLVTGVKDIFQKNVFGTPRIHGTYNEPAYFANALFLGIFLFLFLPLSKINLITSFKSSNKFLVFIQKHFNYISLILSFLCLVLFILSLAKSAWVLLPVIFLIAVPFLMKFDFFKQFKLLFSGLLFLVILALGLLGVSNPAILDNIWTQFVGTFDGQTSTAIERKSYSAAAFELINEKAGVIGIGPGQFGTNARDNIVYHLWPANIPINDYVEPFEKPEIFNNYQTDKTITFNVYLEVWLEYGLISLISLLALFISVIGVSIYQTWNLKKTNFTQIQAFQISLTLYLIASLMQWSFISPVYISPIFIALGLLININHNNRNNNLSKTVYE